MVVKQSCNDLLGWRRFSHPLGRDGTQVYSEVSLSRSRSVNEGSLNTGARQPAACTRAAMSGSDLGTSLTSGKLRCGLFSR